MLLSRALRLNSSALCVAFAGAGGKSTALFQTAREFKSVIITSTTHLGVWQIPLADYHIIARNKNNLKEIPKEGVVLITGDIVDDRTSAIDHVNLNWLREFSQSNRIPLLIEADGSRQKPVKAPDAHEPAIPNFIDQVIVITGLGAIGLPLTDQTAHRAEIFSGLSGLPVHEKITPEAITRVLCHPQGGLKNIPTHARKTALLNQADTPELKAAGGKMSRVLLNAFDSVVVGSLQQKQFHVTESCAGIILAAGESKRFGKSKPLLEWNGKPFIRHSAETALHAGLDPVLVVTGFEAEHVKSALAGLPVKIIFNETYQQGQSTSIKKGIQALASNIGSAIFLLADQPQIPVEVLRALNESHAQNMQAILAPLVLEEKRANPVLFDRVTFPDLLNLKGDIGGRGIFDKHRVEYLPWHDEILLFDVDKPEDYERLKKIQ